MHNINLPFTGFIGFRDRADAGSSPIPPSIHILNAVVVPGVAEAEVSGYVLNTNEITNLKFFFLPSGNSDPIIVPIISTVWDSHSMQWTTRLDLSSIPHGDYGVWVTTRFENGIIVSDTINGTVPNCDNSVCLPSNNQD